MKFLLTIPFIFLAFTIACVCVLFGSGPETFFLVLGTAVIALWAIFAIFGVFIVGLALYSILKRIH